jgi:hypothetical protein
VRSSKKTKARNKLNQLVFTEKSHEDMFVAYVVRRHNQTQADLVDQLFNSSEKRLAPDPLLLARVGKEDRPEEVIPHISQGTPAEKLTAHSAGSFKACRPISTSSRRRCPPLSSRASLRRRLPANRTADLSLAHHLPGRSEEEIPGVPRSCEAALAFGRNFRL